MIMDRYILTSDEVEDESQSWLASPPSVNADASASSTHHKELGF